MLSTYFHVCAGRLLHVAPNAVDIPRATNTGGVHVQIIITIILSCPSVVYANVLAYT
ncbi:hypothetical protein GQ53DRAFT_473102 [Thozetella sp. PMI_491]|nr:hypothetical protein GQ53DRAFT_473102 [Thozetella sp. PMI_491]